ncbi:hypothetical protein L204_104757 [Cryptococcus depauperatus]
MSQMSPPLTSIVTDQQSSDGDTAANDALFKTNIALAQGYYKSMREKADHEAAYEAYSPEHRQFFTDVGTSCNTLRDVLFDGDMDQKKVEKVLKGAETLDTAFGSLITTSARSSRYAKTRTLQDMRRDLTKLRETVNTT